MKNSNRQRVCFDDNITVMCDYKSSERKFLSINERNLYPYNNSNSFPSWTSQKSLKSRSTVGSSFIGRRNRPKSPAIDYPQTDFFQSNKFIPISSVRGFAELNPAFIDDLNNIRPAGEEIHLAIQPGPNWTNRFTPYNRTLDEILDSRPVIQLLGLIKAIIVLSISNFSIRSTVSLISAGNWLYTD